MRIIAFLILAAVTVLADYEIPAAAQPPLVRGLNNAQLAKVIDNAPEAAIVTVPASFLKLTAEQKALATNDLAKAIEPLNAIIEDTRKNIPEVASLSDMEIAFLYLAQMAKSADILLQYSPTNSLEYLIGTGMRMDIIKARTAE